MSADLLSILETIYADARDEQAWLQGVVEVAEPLLDHGFGVSAHTFAFEDDQVALGSICAGIAGKATLGAMMARVRPSIDGMTRTPGMPMRIFAPHPYADSFLRIARLGAEVEKPATEEWLRELSEMGILDMMGIVGGNPSGRGAVMFAPSASVVRPATASLAIWGRVAAHFAAGYRLMAGGKVEPDAVLEPEGRVAHAERSVSTSDREELSLGVRAIDRARGKLRRVDPSRALSLWKGLVAGRWSLVDQFDHDGRRYVLAKRNPLGVRAWRKLTNRETQVLEYAAHGQPHKVIAYELGISVASVGAHLANAASKVGARTRLELVAKYRASGHATPRVTVTDGKGRSM